MTEEELNRFGTIGFPDVDEALASLEKVTLGELPDNALAIVLLFNGLGPDGQLQVLNYVRDLKKNGATTRKEKTNG